ncbi:hypothetical protein GCM10011611_09370 [Aliidongia dinghuensis]|uniref:Uncharacterized protein n=1 Tax=Aliidongia dinghuensis TaxID=1867774 RepID=A0A8J2YRS3_9PROT|nr:DUF6572 domain-containing protein [Aliidongia dinghuensis]GGF05994.1 hypothetical protein GCM10011611_09370 [Aliidongia dinghuensis]
MTIEDTDKIDFVTISDGGEALLTISDHLSWDDQSRHLLLLQEKLNAYLRFTESGELGRKFPETIECPIVFNIVAKFEPSDVANAFLAKAKEAIDAAGFDLRLTVRRSH